jgi:hypothetical protein
LGAGQDNRTWPRKGGRGSVRAGDYPFLARIHEGKSKNLVVIGVHATGSDPEKVTRLLEQYKITYPVCVDAPPADADKEKGPAGHTFAATGTLGLPNAILVDGNGNVVDCGQTIDIHQAAIELLATAQREAAK